MGLRYAAMAMFVDFPSLMERLHPSRGDIGEARDVLMDAAPMPGM